MQLRRRRMDHHARPGPLHGSGHCGDGAVHALYLPRPCTWPRPLGRGRCSRGNVSGALTEQFPRPVDSGRNLRAGSSGRLPGALLERGGGVEEKGDDRRRLVLGEAQLVVEQAIHLRPPACFGAVGDPELSIDVREVELHRLLRDPEHAG